MDKERIQLEQSLNIAIKDVIQTMTGLYIEENTYKENSTVKGEISGVMIITGEKNALMSLTMSKEVASLIIGYMTGNLPSDLSDEEVYDGAAELINMIAGRTKALLTGKKYYFNLTPPFAIVGDKHFILHKNKILKIMKSYSIEGKELLLQVYYID
ncbi:chemotaxis protein CheX [Clostridium ganghwense]|uniref:Chemotaxis protein CheX n=1 Tax=Clostridium ganghwense TaxID=312089 RepID=A0ABT4CPK5_9CLOT|nr:chemotaxis protein CheX [Clostridium ganghwense]MCY6369914.1 chemotaxis protein CheX [Clostridium ganghwense]